MSLVGSLFWNFLLWILSSTASPIEDYCFWKSKISIICLIQNKSKCLHFDHSHEDRKPHNLGYSMMVTHGSNHGNYRTRRKIFIYYGAGCFWVLLAHRFFLVSVKCCICTENLSAKNAWGFSLHFNRMCMSRCLFQHFISWAITVYLPKE